jgi:hypothetical protein
MCRASDLLRSESVGMIGLTIAVDELAGSTSGDASLSANARRGLVEFAELLPSNNSNAGKANAIRWMDDESSIIDSRSLAQYSMHR